LANPQPGSGKFIKTGLWKYTRHPNYFGEAVCWYGISIMAMSLQGGWWTLYSALFINWLLRYLSGVPLLEKKYKDNEEFKAYMEVTPVFIPGCPKKKSNIEDPLMQ